MARLNTLPLQGTLALKSTPFRKFIYGSFLTRSADWMDMTILNWVVYQMTSSPLMLALLNACRLLPVFAFSLPAGMIADRFDRKKVLVLNYFGVFLTTFIIAYIIQKQLPIFLLLGIITVRSFLMTIEVPVRHAFLSDLVSKQMLASAISIQTTTLNLARMIGPSLAGVLLVHFPPGIIMYAVALGALFVMVSLLLIEPVEKNDELQVNRKEKQRLNKTWQYIRNDQKVLSLLLIAIAPMIFGFPYTTMLPLFSAELLQMGPEGFGLLLSVSSLGAIVATVLLSLGRPLYAGRVLILSAIGFGVLLCFFILFSQFYILVLLVMFLIGFSSQYYRTLSRVILQLNVKEAYRGRVLSIALMDRGYIPLGALLIGWVASSFGAHTAGLVMGLSCSLATIVIALCRKDLWNSKSEEN